MKYQIIIDDEVREQAAEAVAQGRVLSLRNDIVFKSFFSKPCAESAYCRRKMISAVIGRAVADTKVLNPELLPTRTDGKFPRLDIHCALEDGSEVDVELQNSMYKDDQVKRSVYYAASLAHNALSAGDQYARLPRVYQIMFMDFVVTDDARLHHSYAFAEREDHTELTDIMQIHYVELPKIAATLKKPAAQLSEIEFWSMLILSGSNPAVRKLLEKLAARTEEMTMTQALLDTMSRDRQEWENQYGYERFVHDCISREKYAFSRGEQKRALEDARNLARLGVSMDIIVQATGLSPEEIAVS